MPLAGMLKVATNCDILINIPNIKNKELTSAGQGKTVFSYKALVSELENEENSKVVSKTIVIASQPIDRKTHRVFSSTLSPK